MVLKCTDLLLYKVPEPVEMDGPLVVATRELFWGSCLGNHVSPTISSASACHAHPPLPLSLSLSLCLFYTLSHTHTHTHTLQVQTSFVNDIIEFSCPQRQRAKEGWKRRPWCFKSDVWFDSPWQPRTIWEPCNHGNSHHNIVGGWSTGPVRAGVPCIHF